MPVPLVWIGLGLLFVNQMGKGNPKTEAAIGDDEKDKALELLEARQSRIEQEQRIELIKPRYKRPWLSQATRKTLYLATPISSIRS